MRNKVISVLTVVVVLTFLWLWSLINLPFIEGEWTGYQSSAFMGVYFLGSVGVLMMIVSVVKWLLKKDDR